MLRDSDSRDQTIVITTTQLKEAQHLGQMTTAQLRHLATCGTRRWFETDEPLIGQGENLDSLLVILQGKVSVSVDMGSTRTLWLYVAGPGSLVDSCALLDPPAAPIAVYALSSVEALEIPRACLLKEINERPAIGYEMMQELCERLSLIARVLVKQVGNEAPRFSPN